MVSMVPLLHCFQCPEMDLDATWRDMKLASRWREGKFGAVARFFGMWHEVKGQRERELRFFVWNSYCYTYRYLETLLVCVDVCLIGPKGVCSLNSIAMVGKRQQDWIWEKRKEFKQPFATTWLNIFPWQCNKAEISDYDLVGAVWALIDLVANWCAQTSS
jgi:hypothetical protein